MNLGEFKAWFEGFTENLDGPPGEKAWLKIQAKVKTITETATSYPVFVDRYVRPHPQWWPYGSVFNTLSSAQSMQAGTADYQKKLDAIGQNYVDNTIPAGATLTFQNGNQTLAWNAADGFRDLGRLEAKAA